MKKIKLLIFTNLLLMSTLFAQNCPDSIRRVGGGVNDSKIQAKFEGDTIPAKVQVEGTDDERFVSDGGVWVSKDKYNSTEVTLILIDEGGNTYDKCSYDADGKLKPNCGVTFDGPAAVQDNGPGGIDIQWKVMNEKGTPVYRVKRKDEGKDTFEEIATVKGSGLTSYTYNDTSAPAGSSCYQVVADCSSSKTTSPTPFECK